MLDSFETLRQKLFALAYRMVGSAAEAEDIVQEAFLRLHDVAPDSVRMPTAFLRKIVTRLCLDHLKSMRVQRETYIGPWLPEPIRTDNAGSLGDPVEQSERDESLSIAFLLLLESLSPEERAVFLLREVFDYEYKEIADILEKSEAACRQLLSRAKKHLDAHGAHPRSTPEEHHQVLTQYVNVLQNGDLNGLMALLAEDVTSLSDGGGRVAAAQRPLYGRAVVARFMMGLMRFYTSEHHIDIVSLNGREALIVRNSKNEALTVILFDVVDHLIQNLYAIPNPEKFTHLDR